jgi:LmbE family N-acetylglucosaminyl deacetylase
MLNLALNKSPEEELKLLCLGAHSDDIEIGCGGSILRLAREFPALQVIWIVFGASGVRAEEARKSAARFLTHVPQKEISIHSFRDGYFPYIGGEIKEHFERLKTHYSPDLIFTHYRNDLHQDHRKICELTWNTFRDHLILEYEIPKYDGDLSRPNLFIRLEKAICEKKINILIDTFISQKNKPWFTKDTFYALLRLRGIESNASSNFAEAFYARKIVY